MIDRLIYRIQDILCKFINFLILPSSKISKEKKKRSLIILFGLVSVIAYSYSIFPIYVHLLIKCIIGAILMFGILFVSLEEKVTPVPWKKGIVIFWFIFGILRFISGFTVSIEYFPLACIWLIAFPCIFLVWNNRRDYEVLFESLYKGFVYPSMLFIVLSILFVPISSISYTGITGNPNAVGQHLLSVFALIIVRYFYGISRKERVINLLFMGAISGMVFFSMSRTATLCIVAVVCASLFVGVLFHRRTIKETVVHFLRISIISVMMTVLLWGINYVSTGILPNYTPVQTDEKAAVNEIVGGYLNRLDGADKNGTGIENYSSGRTGIWKEVIRKWNLLGHPSKDHIVTSRNGDVGNNAHNVFLQFSYDHGVPAGIIFVILVTYAGIIVLKSNKKNAKMAELVLDIHVSYVILGFFTSVNLPFLYEAAFVYYLSYVVLFDCRGLPQEESCE